MEGFDPSLIPKYEVLYSSEMVVKDYYLEVHRKISGLCERYGVLNYIQRPTKFYPKSIRLNKELAGMLYLKARELQLSGESFYKEWAYRKAAWAIDELRIDLREIYEKKSENGLIGIYFIGRKLAGEIKELIKKK
ncbi:MAG: hypothetical protein ACUVWK_02750 [Nitrososphaerales archaeon]